jgi:hypothetical protein
VKIDVHALVKDADDEHLRLIEAIEDDVSTGVEAPQPGAHGPDGRSQYRPVSQALKSLAQLIDVAIALL